MAVLARTPEEDEAERQRQMQMAQLAPPSLAGPGAATGGSSRFHALASAQSGAPRGGSGFVGLDRYQAANQGATQALGDKVVGQVTGARDTARTALGTAQSGFNTAVGNAEVGDNVHLRNLIGTDPVGVLGNPGQAGLVAKMRDATYTGPTSLETSSAYGGIAPAFQAARETGELAKSESGISTLSDKSVTGPRTTGGRALDTSLLLGDQGLRGRLDEARGGIDALGGELTAASTAAQQRADQARQTTDATRTATRDAIGAAQANFDKQIQQQLDLQRAQATARSQAARDAVGAITFGQGLLPTTGQAGIYRTYDANGAPVLDVTSPGMKGNVPEFLTGSPDLGGSYILPRFNTDLASFTAAETAANQPKLGAFADLGLSPAQVQQLFDLAPVGQMANAAAFGTKNINPYSFVEDYWSRLGSPDRFFSAQDPNTALTRENTASAADYARAAALSQLAGPELAQRVLDPMQAAQAGTGSTDLSSFDLGGFAQARNAALNALANRTAEHISGNARNGGSTLFENAVRAAIPSYDPTKSIWTDPSGQLSTLLRGPAATR